AIIWFCGFLFYVSVYGVHFISFISIHLAVWTLFIFLTVCKFNAIFPNWVSGTEEDDEVKPSAPSHLGGGLPRVLPLASNRTGPGGMRGRRRERRENFTRGAEALRNGMI
ncbi:transmembrane protein, partial [Cystoisospora suis]